LSEFLFFKDLGIGLSNRLDEFGGNLLILHFHHKTASGTVKADWTLDPLCDGDSPGGRRQYIPNHVELQSSIHLIENLSLESSLTAEAVVDLGDALHSNGQVDIGCDVSHHGVRDEKLRSSISFFECRDIQDTATRIVQKDMELSDRIPSRHVQTHGGSYGVQTIQPEHRQDRQRHGCGGIHRLKAFENLERIREHQAMDLALFGVSNIAQKLLELLLFGQARRFRSGSLGPSYDIADNLEVGFSRESNPTDESRTIHR